MVFFLVEHLDKHVKLKSAGDVYNPVFFVLQFFCIFPCCGLNVKLVYSRQISHLASKHDVASWIFILCGKKNENWNLFEFFFFFFLQKTQRGECLPAGRCGGALEPPCVAMWVHLWHGSQCEPLHPPGLGWAHLHLAHTALPATEESLNTNTHFTCSYRNTENMGRLRKV